MRAITRRKKSAAEKKRAVDQMRGAVGWVYLPIFFFRGTGHRVDISNYRLKSARSADDFLISCNEARER